MPSCSTPTILFAGSSHPALATEIADQLNIKPGRIKLEQFPDREIAVQILEDVKDKNVFVLQTIALDPNNYLIELLIILDALRRASARSLTVLIPYFGYCRQDRMDLPGVPITAKLIANLLVKAGAHRIVGIDLHEGQLEGFFKLPVDHLKSRQLLIEGLQGIDFNKCVVVAPDIGSIKFARSFADALKVDFAVVNRHRGNRDLISKATLIGNVHEKDILLADDICSTGATLASAAKACQEKGALGIFAVASHGLCIDAAAEKLEESPIEALWITNTIPHTDRMNGCSKIKIVSVAPLLSHAIRKYS